MSAETRNAPLGAGIYTAPQGALTLTFVVPMPPNIANRQMHHMTKHRVRLGYWALLDLMYGHGYDASALNGLAKLEASTGMKDLKAQIGHCRAFATDWLRDNAGRWLHEARPVAARWPRATLRSVMHLGAAMDDGNAMNRHKWVEDWLVTRGYLADDRKKVLTWAGFPEQVVKRDGNYRIEITLERGDAQEAAA